MLSAFIDAVSGAYITYLFMFAMFIVAEILLARSTMSIADRFSSLKIWAIMLPLDFVVFAIGSHASKALGVVPVFTFQSSFGFPIVAALLAAIGGDFLFYWFHRFQHRFLWRFHSVHHCVENMSAANSYHHWSEPVWGQVLVVLPLSFFQIVALDQAVWMAVVMRIYPFYIHSPIKLHFGRLSAILVDNRFHRIHHSVEPRHFDRNFGAITTLWDRMFGTAHFPARDEWPDVGIAAHGEPKTLREWFNAGERAGIAGAPRSTPAKAAARAA